MATSAPSPPLVSRPSWPYGEVKSPDDMRGGLFEWRFVPTNWVDPIAHHHWCIIDDPTLVELWREKLKDSGPATWYRHGIAHYTALISYDPVVRPVLVKVGGFV